MATTEYSLKLKDPRWVARRKEIIERDGHKCRRCSCTTNLQVHHFEYNGEPWEATDEQLITLCKRCHFKIEAPQFEKTNYEKIKAGEPEPGFSKIYHHSMAALCAAMSYEMAVLFMLVSKMDYKNQVVVDIQVKSEICYDLGIKERKTNGPSVETVNNALWKLTKYKLLRRICRGRYLINPEIFARGQWKDIRDIQLDEKSAYTI